MLELSLVHKALSMALIVSLILSFITFFEVLSIIAQTSTETIKNIKTADNSVVILLVRTDTFVFSNFYRILVIIC